MSADTVELLKENLKRLRKSAQWLKRSYDACSTIGIKKTYSDDEFDVFENLVGRFARAVDVIVGKVFRSIDAAELEDSGTTIDAVNRAEKRGIIKSAARIRELRDLRNDIVHEYETDDLRGLFADALKAAPEVLQIVERIEQYCRKFGV